MSNWLKWRLMGLFVFASLSCAVYVHAQDEYLAPAKTPEEAAVNFCKFLAEIEIGTSADKANYVDNPLLGSISRAQGLSLSKYRQNAYTGYQLLSTMVRVMKRPQFDAKIESKNGNSSTVRVIQSTKTSVPEVVVLAEDGGYRVDLFSTYAKWTHTSPQKLEFIIYETTGKATPALEHEGAILRNNCQSNLKQIILGLQQYSQDYDDKLPPMKK